MVEIKPRDQRTMAPVLKRLAEEIEAAVKEALGPASGRVGRVQVDLRVPDGNIRVTVETSGGEVSYARSDIGEGMTLTFSSVRYDNVNEASEAVRTLVSAGPSSPEKRKERQEGELEL